MLDTSSRLLGLLATLQSRRFWRGADLAEHLEVTPRTLRRDVDRLRSLGYTVDATSGPGGGYSLGIGARLPPLLLDDDEAVVVAVALRSAAERFARVGEQALRVVAKLEPLLPPRLRRRVGALEAVTVTVRAPRPKLDPTVLGILAGACRDGEQVELDYRARDGRASTRRVEPYRLAQVGGRLWYLVAWDLGREAWRTFRVDRVGAVRPLRTPVTPRRPPADVADYVAESLAQVPYRHRLTVRLPAAVAELSRRIPAWYGTLEAVDETHSLLHLGADTPELLVCQLVLTGTDFEVVSPGQLGPEVRQVARRLARGLAPRRRRKPTGGAGG